MSKNHKYKIISLIISFLLWYFVVWGKPIEKTLQLQIEPIIQNKQYKVEINPTQIVVKIEAIRSSLRKLNLKDLKVNLNLNKYGPGAYQVRVPIENLKINNAKIKEVTPNFIMVIIKKISSIKVPIKVKIKESNFHGKLKYKVNPAFVEIKGVWEEIKDIKEIETKPIELQDLLQEKVILVDLETPNEDIEITPNKVKIIYLSK